MSDLDKKEQGHVRDAMRFLRVWLGSYKTLADALRFKPKTIEHVMSENNAVSASLAFRVARLLGASIDDLLTGNYRIGACTRCGHVPAYVPGQPSQFVDESTIVEDAPRPAAGLSLVK